MNASNYRVRRATVDDVPELEPLLKATMSPMALEKRFTEFQVLEGPDGKLAGALGLQIAGKQGKIHSETYVDFGLVDTFRPMLWERLQSVAQTQQLVRFWTQETAPFWKQSNFEVANNELKQKLPAAFGDTKTDWLTLKLKEDVDNLISVDKEFALFMDAEKARTQNMYEQARFLKTIAYVLAILLLIFVMIAGFRLLKRSGILDQRPSFGQM